MSEVTLRLGDFRVASNSFNRARRIRGARSSMPDTTILRRDSAGLAVETPQIETVVVADGRWGQELEVDARELADLLLKLKSVWKAYGGDDARVTVQDDGTTLWFEASSATTKSRQSLRIVCRGRA